MMESLEFRVIEKTFLFSSSADMIFYTKEIVQELNIPSFLFFYSY